MKCEKHTNNDAVAECTQCGVTICKECAENTKNLREYCGALCLDCYANNIMHALLDTKEELRKIGQKLKIKMILYFIGLICIAIGCVGIATNNVDLSQLFIPFGVIFCGIYMGIAGWKAAKESVDDYDSKHGATYTVSSDGSVYRDEGLGMKIVFFILSVAFGIIATPISCLGDSLKKKELTYNTAMFEEELARINNL